MPSESANFAGFNHAGAPPISARIEQEAEGHRNEQR